jgi:hypothetical protein
MGSRRFDHCKCEIDFHFRWMASLSPICLLPASSNLSLSPSLRHRCFLLLCFWFLSAELRRSRHVKAKACVSSPSRLIRVVARFGTCGRPPVTAKALSRIIKSTLLSISLRLVSPQWQQEYAFHSLNSFQARPPAPTSLLTIPSYISKW